MADVNIHEICERVCALIQAEFRDEITLLRDYDASVPDLKGDAARLMQAVLRRLGHPALAERLDVALRRADLG